MPACVVALAWKVLLFNGTMKTQLPVLEIHIPRSWFPTSFNFARVPYSEQFNAWRKQFELAHPEYTIGSLSGHGGAPTANGGFGLYVNAYHRV